jgi:hypothetical protein
MFLIGLPLKTKTKLEHLTKKILIAHKAIFYFLPEPTRKENEI